MIEQEKNTAFETYNEKPHRFGRIACIITLAMLICAPFLMRAYLGVIPDITGFLRGFLAVGIIWCVSCVAEYLVYTPMLSAGGSYLAFMTAIEQTFPGLAASPYVVTGATDCHFYQDICENCVRFSPVIYGPEQMKGMHGIDENIEANCLAGAVDFYKTLIGLSQ